MPKKRSPRRGEGQPQPAREPAALVTVRHDLLGVSKQVSPDRLSQMDPRWRVLTDPTPTPDVEPQPNEIEE